MSRIKIGWARREISVNEPVSIPGQMHMRISEGIMDPLYATALCVDGGEGQDAVIFCSIDMTVMRGGIMDRTVGRVAEKAPGFPTQFIVMNATHTHTSCHTAHQPEKSLDGLPIYPAEKWLDFAVEQLSDAIIEAYNTRKEGGYAFGYGYAVVAHSRRSTYLVDKSIGVPLGMNSNGFAIMYGPTKDPDFAGYEAGADHFVNLMYTFDEENKLTGIVINVPCPSQTSEQLSKLSADFWAEVRERVAEKYGPDVFVLTQCAAAGDLSPRILHYGKAQRRRMALKYNLPYDPTNLSDHHSTDYLNKVIAERRDIADRIMFAVDEVFEWASNDIRTEAKIQHEFTTIDLKRRLITKEERDGAQGVLDTKVFEAPENATPEQLRIAQNKFNSMIRRNRSVVERFEEQKPDDVIPMRMHVIRIGEIAFATNRFELYMDYMHRMQARSPFLQTFIIQLAGEENGSYLPTARAAFNRGYGSSMYENSVSPEGGQQIVEATLEILNRMADSDLQ